MKLLRALLQEVNSGYQINRWVTVEVIRLEMIQCFKSKGEPSEDLRVMIRKQFAESYLDSIPTNWIELACSTIGRVLSVVRRPDCPMIPYIRPSETLKSLSW